MIKTHLLVVVSRPRSPSPFDKDKILPLMRPLAALCVAVQAFEAHLDKNSTLQSNSEPLLTLRARHWTWVLILKLGDSGGDRSRTIFPI